MPFFFLLIIFLATLPSYLFAQEEEYKSCLLLVKNAPSDAIASAQEWAKSGGGDPARHCEALAHIKLQEYDKAIAILEKLAKGQSPAHANIAADLYAQAAQASLKAGQVQRALDYQAAGLKLKPNNIDLLIDRALLLGSTGQYFDALDDLSRAKDLDGNRADIYVLTASAYRSLEQYDLASDALDRAIELSPKEPLAFLERGLLRKAKKDFKGAKEDFMKVQELAPHSSAAESAKKHIDELNKTP